MSKPGTAPPKAAGLPTGIPQTAKKVIQSVKEIVPKADDEEIYEALQACGMDPNEAVNKLVTQVPWEVKSRKRDKKKDAPKQALGETKGRPISGASARGGRGGVYGDRGGRGRPTSAGSPLVRENGLHPKPQVGFPAAGGGYGPVKPVTGHSSTQLPSPLSTGLDSPYVQGGTLQVTPASSLPHAAAGVTPGLSNGEGRLFQRTQGWGSPGGKAFADIVKDSTSQQLSPTPAPVPAPAPAPIATPGATPQLPATPPQYAPPSLNPSSPPSTSHGVYSSASDPVLHPSLDARAPGGAVKRELGTVGNQRLIAQKRVGVDGVSISDGAVAVAAPPLAQQSVPAGALKPVTPSGLDSDVPPTTSSSSVIPPLAEERPVGQGVAGEAGTSLSQVQHTSQLRAASPGQRSVGASTQYAGRPSYQPQPAPKTAGSGLEWKAKQPNIPAALGTPGSIGSPSGSAAVDSIASSSQHPQSAAPSVSAASSKLQDLSLQEQKPVLLPNHLQVSEGERSLRFGSFGAGFGTSLGTGFGPGPEAAPGVSVSKAEPGSLDLGKSSVGVASSQAHAPQGYSQQPGTGLSSASQSAQASQVPPPPPQQQQPQVQQTPQQQQGQQLVPPQPQVQPQPQQPAQPPQASSLQAHAQTQAAHVQQPPSQAAPQPQPQPQPEPQQVQQVAHQQSQQAPTQTQQHAQQQLPQAQQPQPHLAQQQAQVHHAQQTSQQQHYEQATHYYSQQYRTEPEVKYTGISAAAAHKYASSPASAAQTAAGAQESGASTTASASALPTPSSQASGLAQSTAASPMMQQQPAMMHPYAPHPGGMPPAYQQMFYGQYQIPPHYNPYFHPSFAPAGASAYPQGPTGGGYPPTAGGAYPPAGATGAVKYIPPYTTKSGGAGGSHSAATGYGAYGGGASAYGGPGVSAGSATGYDDHLTANQFKDSSLYIPQQGQLSRDMAGGMPSSSYYNMPGQAQHAYGHTQHPSPAAAAYAAGMYHPQQSGPGQPGHQLLQPQQPIGNAGAGGGQGGGYQASQRGQQSWSNSY